MSSRLSAQDRLPELIEAAVGVFAAKGYRNTRMADVAAAMGVGAPSLYNYVDSKEGLFALCLEQMAQGDGFQVALPFAAPPLDVTLKRLHGRVTELMGFPVLDSRDWREPAPARAEDELRALISQLFELGYQTRAAVDMIERSAQDVPELEAMIRAEWQTPQLERIERYLGARMDRGELRQAGDISVAARFVVETITWFARHRFHDPDGARLDHTSAKATVTDLIVHAFALSQAR